jgi:hypothetical protein
MCISVSGKSGDQMETYLVSDGALLGPHRDTGPYTHGSYN